MQPRLASLLNHSTVIKELFETHQAEAVSLHCYIFYMWRLCLSFVMQLMPRECINSLFDNFTWTKIWGSPAPLGLGNSAAWLHPQVSVFVILLLFIVMKVLVCCRNISVTKLHPICCVNAHFLFVSRALIVLDVCGLYYNAGPFWSLHACFYIGSVILFYQLIM